jgi:subtilisin family serine protease
MKKNFYLSIAFGSALMLASSPILAQQTGLGNKKTTSLSTLPSTTEMANAPNQMRGIPESNGLNTEVPVYDQIHTPIKWYALENEHNPQYWENVNASKIWIELDQGFSIADPDIHAFLEAQGLTKVIGESQRKHQTKYWIFQLENGTPSMVVSIAKAAQKVVGIKFVEPSVIYTKSYTPNDPLYEYQWGPFVSNFEAGWDYGRGGNSYNMVAVIDDACDWNHEDLYDQVWYGWDYAMEDGDISPDDPAQHKHGTHVTGTVAATIGNGIGVAGMVNDTVYFAKVAMTNGDYSDAAIINALYEIGDIPRISVVNMSLGSEAPSAASEQACNYAWNNGKLLVVASGNNGQGFISWPAAFQAAMAVGSIGGDGVDLYLTAYSQFGNEQEICAPGGDTDTGFGIVSCIPGNDYEAMQGTSMAAPHVAGLAGLLKNLNEDLTNVEIRNILAATAYDFGDQGWDQYFGYGMINAELAIETALGGVTGVSKLDAAEVMTVYPNPATDQLSIAKKIDFSQGRFEVFNSAGKKVMEANVGNGRLTTIQIADLPQGMYILRMTSEKGVASTKFAKI